MREAPLILGVPKVLLDSGAGTMLNQRDLQHFATPFQNSEVVEQPCPLAAGVPIVDRNCLLVR